MLVKNPDQKALQTRESREHFWAAMDERMWHTLVLVGYEPLRLQQGLLLAAYNGSKSSYKDYYGIIEAILADPEIRGFVERWRMKKFGHKGNVVRVDLPHATDVRDADGWSALHFAVYGKQHTMVEFLITEVALQLNEPDVDGNTPLHVAATYMNYDDAKYMLENGANVNSKNNANFTPIHLAASAAVLRDSVGLIQLLLSMNADVDPVARSGTPLHLAAMRGNQRAVELLLKHKANANATSPQGFTPLLLAYLADSVECMRMLLEGGADPNKGVRKMTPLMFAASAKKVEALELLLKFKADPYIKDEKNHPAFDYAIKVSWEDGINMMLEAPGPSSWNPFDNFNAESLDQQVQFAKAKVEETLEADPYEAIEETLEADPYEAIYWCTRCLCLKPESTEFQYAYMLCWYKLHCYNEAATHACAFVKNHPDDAAGFDSAGKIYRCLQDYEASIRYFLKAAALDPIYSHRSLDVIEELIKLSESKVVIRTYLKSRP